VAGTRGKYAEKLPGLPPRTKRYPGWVDTSFVSTTPDPITVTVDGQEFVVLERAGEPGVYDFHWLGGPSGYGFSSATSNGSAMEPAEAAEAIRNFLAQVNPATGRID
jgi:hypothetical protein